ncbi:MAG: ABC transporter permease [Deltaproteobacteria bacterium]|nr:ABC transporter permease [Deltaproteobacteria bacterium]
MGYPLKLALRYMGSKKRGTISVSTAFAILGVVLGVAALATIMSVTGGFHQQFRSKVLGVNAHVLVLKYSTNFREYRSIMDKVGGVKGVVGVAPFSINPMMITHRGSTATGVLVKGVDPHLSLGVKPKDDDEWQGRYDGMKPVLDLPEYVVAGSLDGLRAAKARPAAPKDVDSDLVEDRGEDDAILVPSGAASAAASPRTSLTAEPGGEPVPASTDGPSTDRALRFGQAGRVQLPSLAAEPLRQRAPRADGVLAALPDEDVIPPELDPDPCENPRAVAAMPGVVVGSTLAKNLGLAHEGELEDSPRWTLGDCVTVTSPTIGFSFSDGAIKKPVAKRFRVVAVFEAGFDQYDSKLVYTDLYEAQEFYDHGDTVTGVEMRVDDIDRAGAISAEIGGMLTEGLYHTMDWEELNHGLFTALTIQQWGMSAVLTIIIFVAAFTVIATLIMVVLDKQKEISVLKAMGATDGAILRVFLYQGGIIGVSGTVLGLGLGLVVCKGLLAYGFPLDPKVYFISRLPVLVRPQEFFVTGAIAIVICLLATILPSWYAASLRPADGFRNR